MDAERLITPARQACALVLGIVTALCTLGWYLSVAITCHEFDGVSDNAPPFYPGIIAAFGLVVTLPIAVISTMTARFLVGSRRSRLAWISLCLYFLPMLAGLVQGAWEMCLSKR